MQDGEVDSTESRSGTADEARAVCGALNAAYEFASTMGRQQQRSSNGSGSSNAAGSSSGGGFVMVH